MCESFVITGPAGWEPQEERAVHQGDDRPRREQREPGGEEADDEVAKGGAATHVPGRQPVDAAGDGGGKGEQKGPVGRAERRLPVQGRAPPGR